MDSLPFDYTALITIGIASGRQKGFPSILRWVKVTYHDKINFIFTVH